VQGLTRQESDGAGSHFPTAARPAIFAWPLSHRRSLPGAAVAGHVPAHALRQL